VTQKTDGMNQIMGSFCLGISSFIRGPLINFH